MALLAPNAGAAASTPCASITESVAEFGLEPPPAVPEQRFS